MRANGPLGNRSLARKVAHVAFWTAVFYVLTVGVARLVAWVGGR